MLRRSSRSSPRTATRYRRRLCLRRARPASPHDPRLASTVVPVLNERPRPRALLEALPDEVADAVAPLFPVTRRIHESDELHEAEWDVLVTAASRVRRDSSLNVVAFGSIISDLPYGRDGVLLASQPAGTLLSRSLPSRATELVIPPGVGDVLGMLVREDLAPGFEQQLDKQTLGVLPALLLALARLLQ